MERLTRKQHMTKKRIVMKRILVVVVLSTSLWAFVSPITGLDGQAPVILGSYADSTIRPGATWRICLRVGDHDGDMKDIAIMAYLPGFGLSPTTYIPIETNDCDEFAGCFLLNTPSQNSLVGHKFILRVDVRDARGNHSRPLTYVLTFDSVSGKDIPKKWQAVAGHRMSVTKLDTVSFKDWRRFDERPGALGDSALMLLFTGLASI